MYTWIEDAGIVGESDLERFASGVLDLPAARYRSNIVKNKDHDDVTKTIKLLELWKARHGDNATYQRLAAAFKAISWNNPADLLYERFRI